MSRSANPTTNDRVRVTFPTVRSPRLENPHAKWWKARIGRQKEIDASIVALAEVEYLYAKPHVDNAASASPERLRLRAYRRFACCRRAIGEPIDKNRGGGGRRSSADADLAGQEFAAIIIEYQASTDMRIVSVTTPGTGQLEAPEAIVLATETNDFALEARW